MPFENKYSLEDYNKAIELHKKGYGSLRISKILGYSTRNAIESWINQERKPYYFSDKRINWCNSKENIQRIRKMNKITQPKACKISAELRRKKLSLKAKKCSKELGYILGTLYGDGHISIAQRRVILSVIDQDFALKFKETLEKWCGFKARYLTRIQKPDKYVKSRKLQYRIYLDSKEVSEFLKYFNLNLIKKASTDVKCTFLRGFFDSEGCATKKDILCYNTNFKLIKFISDLLNMLQIDHTLREIKTLNNGSIKSYKPCYRIGIYKKGCIYKYYNTVNFSIQRKRERLENLVKTHDLTST